ncbi:transcription factor Adf-1-like [Anoplophora glabripennis]|uniref:transcription factor Adf-1-like n=1 Tax=Anoplophora glabripennis TaxID=217634 RepID=UPI000874C7A3|nr:transcription factor Adf-1-like [Anoplophora glabripennis]
MYFHDYASTSGASSTELDPELPEVDLHFESNNKEGDELLIDLIKSYPALYNKENSDYKDAIVKENSWKEIAFAMNLTVLECQTRWTRLRQYYSKERLLNEKETRSGQSGSVRKKWPLFDSMLFLEKHINKRKTFSNMSRHSIHLAKENMNPTSEKYNEVENYSSTVSKYEIAKRLKKSKLDPIENAFLNINSSMQSLTEKLIVGDSEESEEDTFGKLIAKELKKVPEPKKKNLKKQILDVIYSE